MSDDSPYERVTQPERFAPLHQVAIDLVDDLGSEFDVLVEAVEPEGRSLKGGAISAVRVSPSGGGVAITITLTGFPGLFVRFGAQHTEAFPHCGCDACDEQPDQLSEELRAKVRCVTLGRYSEWPGGYRFDFDDGGARPAAKPCATSAEGQGFGITTRGRRSHADSGPYVTTGPPVRRTSGWRGVDSAAATRSPTSAATAPSPTRKLTSSKSTTPVGSCWRTFATSTCPREASVTDAP